MGGDRRGPEDDRGTITLGAQIAIQAAAAALYFASAFRLVLNRHRFTARCFDTSSAPTVSSALETNCDGSLWTKSGVTRHRNWDISLVVIAADAM